MRLTDEERAILDRWPTPPVTVVSRLAHTVEMFKDSPAESVVVQASSGLYRDSGGAPVHTGLTHGDLRALLSCFDPNGPWWSAYRWAHLMMRASEATAAMWAHEVVSGGVADQATDEGAYWAWFGETVNGARGLAEGD